MAPELNYVLLTSSRTSTMGSRRRWGGLMLALLVLIGPMMTACTASDEKLTSALATADDVETRQKKAAELAERHSVEATEALVAAASDANAAAGLAALRDAYIGVIQVAPQEQLSDKESTALLESIDCLAAIGDAESVAGLRAFVMAAGPWTIQARVHAVEALGALPPEAALESLVKAVAIPSGDGAAEVRAAAVLLLSTRPEAAPALVAVRESAGQPARVAMDGLLVAWGAPAAEALVAALATDPDGAWIPDLLCSIGTPAVAATGVALDDPSPVRFHSLDALLCLRSKDAAAVDALLVTPDRVQLLIAARSQTGSVDSAEILEDLLLAIGEPAIGPIIEALGTATWATGLLARFGSAAAEQLATRLGSDDAAIRKQALGALLRLYSANPAETAPYIATPERVPMLIEAYLTGESGPTGTLGDVLVSIGQPAASELVKTAAGMLTDQASWTDDQTARRVYYLIKRFDNEQSTNALVDAVAQGSADRLRVLFLAVKLGIPGSEERLNDLLMQHGDVSMAEDYLNSGSSLLYQGGERWATAHGYYVEEGPGSSRTNWGRF